MLKTVSSAIILSVAILAFIGTSSVHSQDVGGNVIINGTTGNQNAIATGQDANATNNSNSIEGPAKIGGNVIIDGTTGNQNAIATGQRVCAANNSNSISPQKCK